MTSSCFFLHTLFSGSRKTDFCLPVVRPFVPVSNSWITSQPSLRGEERERLEMLRRDTKTQLYPNICLWKGPGRNPELNTLPKRVKGKEWERAGKTCTCGCSVNKRQEIAVTPLWWGLPDTQSCTNADTRQEFLPPPNSQPPSPDRCLLRQQSFPFLLLGPAWMRSRDWIWEKKAIQIEEEM